MSVARAAVPGPTNVCNVFIFIYVDVMVAARAAVPGPTDVCSVFMFIYVEVMVAARQMYFKEGWCFTKDSTVLFLSSACSLAGCDGAG